MSALFSGLSLRALILPNRIVVAPMRQFVARAGRAHAWHLVHLGSLAQSGAGMLMIECAAVEPAGRVTPGDLGLWDDATESALQVVISALRQVSDIAIGLQIGHAGARGSVDVPWRASQPLSVQNGGWSTVAPCAQRAEWGGRPSVELDMDGIRGICEAFSQAAARAARLGVDALELHGGHGYLIHQFLSPLYNHRLDDYGGSLENRMRFVIEVFEGVRAAFPEERPVGIKLSVADGVPGGWDVTQSVALASTLKQRGVDWISTSTTQPDGGRIAAPPLYHAGPGAALRRQSGIRLIGSGSIDDAQQAENLIAQGQADLVAIGRGMLYDPRWGWRAASELHGKVRVRSPYAFGAPRPLAEAFIRVPEAREHE